jgi:hypothetical protein
VLAVAGAAVLAFYAAAQPGGKPADGPGKGTAKDYSSSPIVVRMMAFDKDKDGKLTRDEVTDPRLQRLFDMADTDKDGVVTREELMALAAKLEAELPQGDDRGGPGDPGGPGGRGPGGFGGPPQPGKVLPPRLLETLNLTADQKKQLDDLQKEVDARLGKILTGEQRKQLEETRDGPGRGGPGGPGGRGPGAGGPGGRGPGRGGPGDERPPG